MEKELRILMLEDSSADAELEEYELKRSGLVFTLKVVDTKETFREALEEFSPDLILADYDLPTFDGLNALELAKGKCPDVPFILVTGRVGEEFAIETLKKGATDYVMKNNLKRLVPVINRALEEAKMQEERKLTAEAIKRNASQWQKTFDSIKNLIMLLDKDFKIIRANIATRDFLGMPFDKIIGQYCFNLMHGTDEPLPECPLAKLKKSQSHEESVIFLENRNIWVSVLIDPIFNEKGELIQAVHIIEDITERKKAEESIRESVKLYGLLAENTYDMITRHLPDGTYLYVSPSCQTLFGYEPKELIGTKAFDQIHPEDVKRVIAITQEAVRTGGAQVAKYRHVRKDGQYIWVETIGKVIKNKETGAIEDIVCVVRDITEHKKAEEDLENKVSHIENLNKMFTGKEIQMIELKKEVNSLLEQLGQPKKYMR
jgi:PAS domain S-box-containing protein